jgi:hypothetical protein
LPVNPNQDRENTGPAKTDVINGLGGNELVEELTVGMP